MIRIISYNICCMPVGITNIGSNNDMKKERLELFFKIFSKDTDIIMLSEIWETPLSLLSKSRCPLNMVLELGHKYKFNYIIYGDRKIHQVCNNGLVILSKLPILESDMITFNSSTGLQYFVTNGALYAKIRVNNKNLLLFNTHIHSGPLDTKFMNSIDVSKNVQLEQIKQLKQFINSAIYNNPNSEYLLSGDFNSDAHESKAESSMTMLEYTKIRDIMNSESLLHKKNFPSTYPVPKKGSFLVNPNFNGEESCIDHVFTSLNHNKVDVDVKTLKVNNLHLSDHAALFIKLEL